MKFPGRSGMTLVEVLIAMLILAGGLILIANSWSGTYGRLRKTQQTIEVAALMQRKMVEIEMEYKGKPLGSIPEEKADDFGSEYPQYSWKMESKEFEMPDLTPLLVSRDEGANGQMLSIMKQFSDHLSKSIKEVKLTITFKAKKARTVNYTVTTYFVDYDKEIPLPGIGGLGQ